MASQIIRHASLADLIEQACSQYASRVAYICDDDSLTFAQVGAQSQLVANGLTNHCKVETGARVAVMLPNVIEFPTITFGILRSNIVQVNINPLYTASELTHQIRDSGARTVFVHAMALPTLAEAVAECDINRVIVVGDATLTRPSIIETILAHAIVEEFGDFLAKSYSSSTELPSVKSEDLAFLQYTGGTTGYAKGAMLSHGNVTANVAQFIAHSRGHLLPGEETVLTAIPAYHIFALTVNTLAMFALGGTNVLITNPRDVDGLLEAWARAPISFATGVNTLFNSLINHPKFADLDFSSLKFVVGGGAPVQETVSERWRAITGRHLCEGYGLSETSPVLTMTALDDEGFHSSIGVPMPLTDIAIRDDLGNSVPVGVEGELCARGPQIMQGYWQNPSASAEVLTADGYFRTGDIARIGEDGRLRIVDRKKDMILVSGFNVYPNEIEAIVARMDGVLECACVGRLDEKSGEAVVLYVVKNNTDVSEAAVRAFCRENLAAYKIPTDIHFINELPKSTVGKILRRELREAA